MATLVTKKDYVIAKLLTTVREIDDDDCCIDAMLGLCMDLIQRKAKIKVETLFFDHKNVIMNIKIKEGENHTAENPVYVVEN